MKIKRLSKVVVSLLSGMLLLLCQTAFATNSCTLPALGTCDAGMVRPYHDASPVMEDHPSGNLCSDPCASPGLIPGMVKFTLTTAADLPALRPRAERQYLATYIVPPPSSGITRASPPLLPIILCRLLI